MDKKWITWQLNNAGAEKVAFLSGGKERSTRVEVSIDNWSYGVGYETDRDTTQLLTRAIRVHLAEKANKSDGENSDAA